MALLDIGRRIGTVGPFLPARSWACPGSRPSLGSGASCTRGRPSRLGGRDEVMGRYSAFRLLVEGFRNQSGWQRARRDPEPKPAYDVIIIGGGGHGLASA